MGQPRALRLPSDLIPIHEEETSNDLPPEIARRRQHIINSIEKLEGRPSLSHSSTKCTVPLKNKPKMGLPLSDPSKFPSDPRSRRLTAINPSLGFHGHHSHPTPLTQTIYPPAYFQIPSFQAYPQAFQINKPNLHYLQMPIPSLTKEKTTNHSQSSSNNNKIHRSSSQIPKTSSKPDYFTRSSTKSTKSPTPSASPSSSIQKSQPHSKRPTSHASSQQAHNPGVSRRSHTPCNNQNVNDIALSKHSAYVSELRSTETGKRLMDKKRLSLAEVKLLETLPSPPPLVKAIPNKPKNTLKPNKDPYSWFDY
ncbi:hypothetical protein O181_034685 [Austropuccinia psidii MF-1]|uniref:Uncharacterized protein n=1 Tax=Austropuccinia psidii MF-1 TaxID=1389203 RepID=A0A9Q3D3F9_9BASI|nr:hypothetical protein [Austropuccinia psidii MF-1]